MTFGSKYIIPHLEGQLPKPQADSLGTLLRGHSNTLSGQQLLSDVVHDMPSGFHSHVHIFTTRHKVGSLV